MQQLFLVRGRGTQAARALARRFFGQRCVGNVMGDSAITGKGSCRTEPRLSAEGEMPLRALGINERILEIPERLVRVHDGLVPRPSTRIGIDRGQIPSRLA